MQLYSTNNPSLRVPLKKAVLQGLPEDNGLYMPVSIPRLPDSFFSEIKEKTFPEMAFEVAKHLIRDAIPEEALHNIIQESITFDAPLVKLNDWQYILELFHGPTLAFKDFGARFMARMMGYFVKEDPKPLHILVATSGDTGGAVASGFYKTPGISVTILYPKGKVSLLQEKQLTTLGENITAIEVDGTFDDCQALVKQAFLDKEVQPHIQISSANSINIARLIPQMFYYFRAYQQILDKSIPLAFCVPSGNFGNLTAGLMAHKMGLPVSRFIAATNINDIVPAYLKSGKYSPRPSIATISNAMDVGKPSNFARMLDLYEGNWELMKEKIMGYSFTDEETRQAIKKVRGQSGYLLDTHGAVGYLALEAFQSQNSGTTGIILGTAHPSKFLDVIEPVIGEKVEVPERLDRLRDLPKEAISLGIAYEGFKGYLMGL